MGKRTKQAIFLLRMMIERVIENQKGLYMCILDYDLLVDVLTRFVSDKKLIRRL